MPSRHQLNDKLDNQSVYLAEQRRTNGEMKESLLYILHSNGINPGVVVDRNRFREVFTSKYGKVRIYKIQSVSEESKEWVLNNRVCDAPGSWFFPGQYPLHWKKFFPKCVILPNSRTLIARLVVTMNTRKTISKTWTKGSILVVLMAVKAKKGTIKKLSPETIGQYNEKRHWQRTFTRWLHSGYFTTGRCQSNKDTHKEISAQDCLVHWCMSWRRTAERAISSCSRCLKRDEMSDYCHRDGIRWKLCCSVR